MQPFGRKWKKSILKTLKVLLYSLDMKFITANVCELCQAEQCELIQYWVLALKIRLNFSNILILVQLHFSKVLQLYLS